MKKLFFGATIKLSLDKKNGIMKKVFAQAKVFSQKYDVYVWGFTDHEIVYIHDHHVTVVDTFKNKYDRRKKYFSALKKAGIEMKIDYLYFRFASTDFLLLSLLKKYHKNKIKNIIEIPTYPYAGEFQDTLKKRLIYLLDCILRGNLKKYVFSVVNFIEPRKDIYGIPCINTMNGVDFSELKLVSQNESNQSNSIKMIAVSSMLPHHGYDRMIRGISEYYSNPNNHKNIILNLIGMGPEYECYKSLTEELHIENHIVFSGQLTGEKLDQAFDESVVAIGSLGLHRIGLKKGSTLKNREYVARGLPIVYSTRDELLKDMDFAMEVSSDETPIEINAVLDFVEKVYTDVNANKNIREKSFRLCDMSVTMKPVTDALENIVVINKGVKND